MFKNSYVFMITEEGPYWGLGGGERGAVRNEHPLKGPVRGGGGGEAVEAAVGGGHHRQYKLRVDVLAVLRFQPARVGNVARHRRIPKVGQLAHVHLHTNGTNEWNERMERTNGTNECNKRMEQMSNIRSCFRVRSEHRK